MVPGIQTAYPPDYKKTVQQVMYDKAPYLASHGDGLPAVYGSYSLHDDRSTEKSRVPWTVPPQVLQYLPTWVCADWLPPSWFPCPQISPPRNIPTWVPDLSVVLHEI